MAKSTGTTGTTTQADEVCIGAIATDFNPNFTNPSNSFTEVVEANGSVDVVLLERIVSSIGTFECTVTFEGAQPSTYALCGAMATFKAAGSSRRRSISQTTVA